MGDPRARGRKPQRRPAGGRPPAAKPRVDAPRAAAFEALKTVRVEAAYTNLVLPHILREAALSGRDAAFVTELVSGTIRRQGTYDAILRACVDRPLAKVELKVLDALRLGTHQLLSMRVPTHAAISTTVDLVRHRVGQGAAGFTNAVLRKVSAHDLDQWVRRVAPSDPVGFASIAHSHPQWIVTALGQALAACGRTDEADLTALLSADNDNPLVTLVAFPGLCSTEEIISDDATLTGQSPYAVQLAGGDPAALPAVASGRAGVQDEGSQLMALALAGAALEGRDLRWLDVCAGPGGKSALLASLAVERGATVLASEKQEQRAGLVKRGTRAVSGGLRGIVVADGVRPPWRNDTFDRVLVDAPCSGLGALRRRPESRWRRTPQDVLDLVALQRDLLTRALDAVRPGGLVAYVTCSPVLEETSGVVEHVLGSRDDVKVVDAVASLSGLDGVHLVDCAGPLPGTVQLWPDLHRTDAMFLALLQKF